MKQLFLSLFTLGLCFTLSAQIKVVDTDRFAFDEGITYLDDIQSPADYLGYELGAHMVEYERITEYMKTLAANSPRVLINEYGRTYEDRPLINLVISSEANINRIDEIRAKHLALLTASSSEAEAIIENEPIFTSLSYNIHGNEISTSEAALQVAYRLAAGDDPEIKEVLDNSVIILYICINPDGRNRYAYWYNTMARVKTPGLEPADLEHFAPWPNGRTNHYWFDLNRDWIWGVHPESRGHINEYTKWMPQVHADYHEQGYNSNYFTMPGTTPRNMLLPDRYEAWTDTFGMANVRAFDKKKLNYFTRTSFDFFYPAYGSSYPTIMGAIGMLTEQGGIGGGRVIETNDGYVLTLRQRIFDHYTTSMATIKKSVERKEDLLRYSYEAWQPKSNKTKTEAYLLDGEDVYTNDVVNILLRHGVKVMKTTEDLTVKNALDFRTGKSDDKSFPAGSILVSTKQAKHLFITTLMERNMAIEDSVMYDMSTWSAPLAYNIEAYSLSSTPFVGTEEITEELAANKGFNKTNDPYAYVINWNQRHAPKALAKLWEKKYRVRSADGAFTDQNGKTYPPGTLIVLAGRNLEKKAVIEADLEKIAMETGVVIDSYQSGRMKTGMDLASSKNRPIKQPKVAMLVEPPFSTYTCGQIYFLFDQETELPVERVRASVLQQTALPKFGSRYGLADLNNYDVLILAGGGSGLRQLFPKEQLAVLKDWVRRGGTIVATESAANFFTKKASGFTNVQLKPSKRDTSAQANYVTYEDRQDYFGKKRIPGTALNGVMDVSHPLAFGVDPEVYTLKFGTDAYVPNTAFQTVGHYHKDPKQLAVAGYASEENLKHLAGGSFAGVANVGRGKVIFLLDNTHYRMFWRGPSRMMQNAVMLMPGF